MKFADPHSVTCSQCGKRSEHAVKTLLALDAACPFCKNGLAADGRQMQLLLDGTRAFAIVLAIEFAIEDQNPGLHFDDHLPVANDKLHELCLDHVLTMLEALVGHVPAAMRRDFCLKALEAGFRAEFPDSEYPPLDAQLAYTLTEEPFARRFPPLATSSH